MRSLFSFSGRPEGARLRQLSRARGPSGRPLNEKIVALLIVLIFETIGRAQSTAVGPPFGPDEAKSKVGEFLASFTLRSPESAIAKIDKRMGLKPAKPVEDYDLSKEVFDVYVPKEPGTGGKYGVMVSMCFPGHLWPPATWKPVLEQYHLIWIGATVTTDPRPAEQHAGLLLDATFNLRKLWPTDENRIYLATNTGEGPITGLAFYYSDIFNGAIISPVPTWFTKITDTRPPNAVWSTDNLARPQSTDWDRAKKQSRFFIAQRELADDTVNHVYDLILHQGFDKSGFKHVKAIKVAAGDMELYVNWRPEWFEQGIQFLDSTPAPGAVAISAPKIEPPHVEDAAAKANGSLQMAKNYVELGRYDSARTKLQQIVDTYPGTPAAKEAQEVLKEIQDK